MGGGKPGCGGTLNFATSFNEASGLQALHSKSGQNEKAVQFFKQTVVGRAHASWPTHFHLIVQHMCWITNTWQGHIHAHFLQGGCRVLCLCEQLPYKHVYQMGEYWVCIKNVPNGCLCTICTVSFWDSSNVEKAIMLHVEGVEPKPCHSHRACHKCGSCSNAWRVSIFMNSWTPCSSKSLSLWAIASLTCSLMTQLW